MPPTITPEGQRAKNRIAEFRQNVNLGATPKEARATLREIEQGPKLRTGFSATIPESIPSTAISEGGTFTDVRARRDQMESDQLRTQQFDTDFNNLMGRVQSPLKATPFQNPEQFINEMLLRRPSETETQLGNVQSEQAQGFRDVGQDLNKTRENLTNEFDIGGLQASLAETRNRIAERTTQLRQSLRDFETNSEKRGVARPFVEAEKQKVQADAAAELADLAIIESAQSGNLQMAREDIDRALNQKIQAFEFENMAIQAEIQRLEKMDSKESEVRSQQLQMALGERNRLVEKAVADERQKLEYLSEAAANGADQGTLDAIRKATNVGEAAMMAGPFIGRLERQAKQASIAQGWAGVKLRQDELELARQKFENETNDFGTGTVTVQDGQKAVVNEDGTLTPISEIDFNNPAQVEALPVSALTKAVLQGFAKTKDFTPTQKAEIMTDLQKIGFNPNTYITNKLNGLVQSWVAVPESSRGYLQGLKFWESKTDEDVAGFESQKTLLTREIARLFDVGVLSDQDVASYKDAMPSRQDADIAVVLRKAGGISGAATGRNTEGVGTYVQLPDGRTAILGLDGNTLLDPATGKPLE